MRRLSDDQAARIASRARAIGDPTRVRILNVLARGESPVGQVANMLATQQSTVSKHLQVLFNAGLVRRRREASTVIYSLFDPELFDVCSFLARRSLVLPAEVVSQRMEVPRSAKANATSRRRVRR
jgi:ArsR family transcriptional regulator